jgi:hypothetical protein
LEDILSQLDPKSLGRKGDTGDDANPSILAEWVSKCMAMLKVQLLSSRYLFMPP